MLKLLTAPLLDRSGALLSSVWRRVMSSRYNYASELEEAVNQQIKKELTASHIYLSMAAHFAKTNIALPGASGMFLGMYDEERHHALELIKYQILRGGQVVMGDVPASAQQSWSTLEEAFQAAVQVETENTNALHCLYKVAEQHQDIMFMDFLTTNFLQEQLKEFQKFDNLLVKLKRAGDGPGLAKFDSKLAKQFPYKGPLNIAEFAK